jgi:transposase
MLAVDWHTLTVEGTLRELNVNLERGLTAEEAASCRQKYGVNELPESPRPGFWRRPHLERLPGYAPDLNPDEGVWHYLKSVALRNLCCQNLSELRRALQLATWRLRQKPHILVGCFEQVRLGAQL